LTLTFCTVGDRNYCSTHGSLQPGFGCFAFHFGKKSLQQVFGASSNEKWLHEQGIVT